MALRVLGHTRCTHNGFSCPLVLAQVLGFLYTLMTHPRVPEGTRNSTMAWGLCPDAWPDSGHMPQLIYVREAVRLRGDEVSTQNTIRRGVCVPTSVGLGSW